MKLVHECEKHLEYSHTIDRFLGFGDIDSYAVFKCSICGKEINEYDRNISESARTKRDL